MALGREQTRRLMDSVARQARILDRITADLLTAAGETTSWIPGDVCAGLLAVVAVLMLGRSGSLPVPVKGIVRAMSLVALLATLVLLFGFQGEQILAQPLVIALLAVPILIQVYFNAGIAYWLSRRFGEGVVNGALTARVGVAALAQGRTDLTVVDFVAEPVGLAACAAALAPYGRPRATSPATYPRSAAGQGRPSGVRSDG